MLKKLHTQVAFLFYLGINQQVSQSCCEKEVFFKGMCTLELQERPHLLVSDMKGPLLDALMHSTIALASTEDSGNNTAICKKPFDTPVGEHCRTKAEQSGGIEEPL